MKQSYSTVLTLLICALLLAEGIWGLFSPVVFGVLTTNRAHAIIHIVLGVGGLLAWWKGYTKSYFGFLGSLLLVVAIVWIVPPTREVPRGMLAMNGAVAAVNFLVGILSLVVAITAASRRRFGGSGFSNPPMGASRPPRKVA